MQLAHELLNSSEKHLLHVGREDESVEVKDPSGREAPLGSCLFIFGISENLGLISLIFFPQPEEKLVLVALDEAWALMLEKFSSAQRKAILTNVITSFLTNPEAWSQVYLIY